MKTDITLRDIYQAIEDFRKEVREQYVTKVEFEPVRNIAYGIVSAFTLIIGIGLFWWAFNVLNKIALAK